MEHTASQPSLSPEQEQKLRALHQRMKEIDEEAMALHKKARVILNKLEHKRVLEKIISIDH